MLFTACNVQGYATPIRTSRDAVRQHVSLVQLPEGKFILTAQGAAAKCCTALCPQVASVAQRSVAELLITCVELQIVFALYAVGVHTTACGLQHVAQCGPGGINQVPEAVDYLFS